MTAPNLEVSVWVRLMKAHGLMLRAVRRGVGPGLTLPQFDVMAQIARSRDGLTTAELSRRLLVTAGNLTGVIGRMEQDGLVTREAHERDRRASRIRLTPAGRRLLRRTLPRHTRDIHALMRGVPRADLRRLRSLLGRLSRTLENGAAPGADGVPPAPPRHTTPTTRRRDA